VIKMMKPVALVVASVLMASAPARAQDPPPAIPGVTGTIALDGTVDKFYGATHQVLVKTADGVRHLLHLSSRTEIHGNTPRAEGPFDGLEEGSQVVVQYVADGETKTAVEIDRVGNGGLKTIEGAVTNLDRAAKTLTVRLADDSEIMLRLTDRAAHHLGKNIESQARVVVYYADDGGEWVAHYFKRASGAR
jgi:hypothetical protein